MIPDGESLMIGGFMGVGTPERIVEAGCAKDEGIRESAAKAAIERKKPNGDILLLSFPRF